MAPTNCAAAAILHEGEQVWKGPGTANKSLQRKLVKHAGLHRPTHQHGLPTLLSW